MDGYFYGAYRRRGTYRGDTDCCQQLYGILVLILGIILMIVIFFLPDGVLGYFMNKFKGKADKQMVKG